jgi:hypothetical protein
VAVTISKYGRRHSKRPYLSVREVVDSFKKRVKEQKKIRVHHLLLLVKRKKSNNEGIVF